MTLPGYPEAPREDVAEIIHGHEIADPYRWLEDSGSEQTKRWLAAEADLYASYLSSLPGLAKLTDRLGGLLAAGEVGPPAWRGDRQFFTRREPGQEHAVLYTVFPAGAERALIDPTVIDPTGVTTLDRWEPDQEGRLLAYQLSEGGREESVLRVLDVSTGLDVDGPIDRLRYSDVAWLPGGTAFYYARSLAAAAVPAGQAQFHRRVYLHQIATPADEDILVFGAGQAKTNYYGLSVSHDGRWLTITASAGTAPRNDAWLADLSASDPRSPNLQVIQEGADATAWPRAGRDGRLYILTDRDAPRGRVVVAEPGDPAFPEYASWQELIPEDPAVVLTDFAILDGDALDEPVLLLAGARHAISEVSVHDLAFGDRLGGLELPGLGTVTGLTERPAGGHQAWFLYTDYTTPGVVLSYDAASGSTAVWRRAPGVVDIPAVTVEQIAYTSADGTTVRMVVVSGATSNGERQGTGSSAGPVPGTARPAILYGYGGFRVSLTPVFSAAVLAWVEAGGIYAIAGLRGGSEEGEEWHRAGMRERKQRVLDDFYAAAEKLIADGWTTSDQLTIWGGSNGGLLVGAAMTQRPELSAAAVCQAALLDMVRYERFGLGVTWNDEFGTAADPAEFEWLIGYSPYHHVRPGTRYPAVLFTISDGDTRVDTLHVRKMCAAIQHATTAPPAKRPVLLRNEARVGHGPRALSRSIALTAETLAFAAVQTGLPLG